MLQIMQIFELFATISLKDAEFLAAVDNVMDKAKLLSSSVINASDETAAAAEIGLAAASGSISAFAEMINQTASAAADSFASAIDNLLDSARFGMFEVGNNMVAGLWAGIHDQQGWLHSKMNAFLTSFVSGIKNFLGIKSPSTLFRDEIGAQIPAGLAEGIDQAAPSAANAAANLAKSVFDNAKLWISAYRLESDYLASEELAMWEHLSSIYSEFQKQKLEADQNAARLRTQITKDELAAKAAAEQDSFDISKHWIETRKFFGLLSLEEEAAAWERVQSRYEEGTKLRENADRALFDVRRKLLEEQESIIARIDAAELKYAQSLDSRTQAIFNSFRLFDELREKDPVSGADLTENLRAQVELLRSWADDIAALSQRGIADGLLAQLQELGPAAAAEIRALASMSDSELSDYSLLWADKYAIAKDLAVAELAGLRAETNAEILAISSDMERLFADSGAAAGDNFIQNTIDSLKNRSDLLLDSVRAIASNLNLAFSDSSAFILPDDPALADASVSINFQSAVQNSVDSLAERSALFLDNLISAVSDSSFVAALASSASELVQIFADSGSHSGVSFIQNAIAAISERSVFLLDNVRAIASSIKFVFADALSSSLISLPAASIPDSHADYNYSASSNNQSSAPANSSSSQPLPANIVLNLNGVEMARALINDLRSVNGASPQFAHDF